MSPPRKQYKPSRGQRLEDESSIPLLPDTMSDDKVKSGSPVVDTVGSDSETSSRDIPQNKKAPWWSYIWVS